MLLTRFFVCQRGQICHPVIASINNLLLSTTGGQVPNFESKWRSYLVDYPCMFISQPLQLAKNAKKSSARTFLRSPSLFVRLSCQLSYFLVIRLIRLASEVTPINFVCSLPVLRIWIRDPVPLWPRDPGWAKNQDPDPG